jgi:hypothetical protein
MTKTKKQLREEAVERLKNTAHWLMCFYADGEAAYWYSGYQPERESVGQSMLKDIELLTDDPNDDSAPEKVVKGGAADVTTESCDSREKLEADALDFCTRLFEKGRLFAIGLVLSSCDGSEQHDELIKLLDRQAAITEREAKCRVDFSLITQTANAMFTDYQEQVAELQARVDELAAERDDYREKLSRALDLAHEMLRTNND